jgi:hypothetical protein
MPLPYAPPPKDSKVYRDLKNLKISSVTADQMDTLKAQLFAQGVNGSEDEMRRLQLLGEVSNQQSSSGPIPGTCTVTEISYDANQYYNYFIPGEGEVWKVMAVWCFTATGFTSAVFSLYDTVNNKRVYAGDWGSGGGDLEDSGFPTELYFDSRTYPQFYPYGTLSSTATTQMAAVRVR